MKKKILAVVLGSGPRATLAAVSMSSGPRATLAAVSMSSGPRATLALLIMSSLAMSCGGATPAGRASLLDDLRRRAADRPTDFPTQRALAIAEFLAPGGNGPVAEAQMDRALALQDGDPMLLHLKATALALHGDVQAALETNLRALEASLASDDPLAPSIAEITLGGISDVSETTSSWEERVVPLLTRTLANRSAPLPVRHSTAETLMGEAFRRNNHEEAARLAEAMGCVQQIKVIGPIGPRELLAFDSDVTSLMNAPLPERYDLGPGRGIRPAREISARGCSLHLGNGPVGGGGMYLTESVVAVAESGAHVVRLETPNAVELYVDGQRALRLDARKEPTPRVTYQTIQLTAGRHDFKLRIASRHPNPIVVLSVNRTDDPRGLEVADAGFPAGDYVRTLVSFARGDAVSAGLEIRDLVAPDSTPAVLIYASAVALSDPFAPPTVRRDDTRRYLQTAAQRDPDAWYPALQLARLNATDGQQLESIRALRAAVEKWPNVVVAQMALAEMLASKGWDAERDQVISRARALAPGACAPMRAEYNAALSRFRGPRATELADAVVRCDARSDAKYATLVRLGRYDDARGELERLKTLEPPHNRVSFLWAELDLARTAEDTARSTTILRTLRELTPQSTNSVLGLSDLALAAGQPAEAIRLLDEALNEDPSAMSELRRVRRAIGGEDEMKNFRVDGLRRIADFKASGRTYDQGELLVFDYAAVRVMPDGSVIELVHQIYRLQSEEAVDAHGEFGVPNGSRVLTLRTIKDDGRILEPDQIAGKDTISLPNLAVGDYVETEYLREGTSPAGFPGGMLGDRFFFQSFETPFDFSELVVITPKSMQLVVDPRGQAPTAVVTEEGDLRVQRFSVHESRPLRPERGSVTPREYISSVGYGVRATWAMLIEGMRDALIDRDVRDPNAVALLEQIWNEARSADAPLATRTDKAKALYYWTLAHVEDNDEFFGLAPAMLRGRTGHRARILKYLLNLAGVPAEIAAVRSNNADLTPSELADGETYTFALVVFRDEADAPVFLATTERDAPFQYLPPSLRGAVGLMLTPGAERVTTPPDGDGTDRRTVTVHVDIAADGRSSFDVVEELHGATALAWRGNLRSIPEAELRTRFEASYVAQLIPGAELRNLQIEHQHELALPLVLRYSFVSTSYVQPRRDGLGLPMFQPVGLADGFAPLATRTTTLLIGSPSDYRTVVTYTAAGRRFTAPTSSEERDASGATFRLNARIDPATSSLVVERDMHIEPARIAPADYPGFAAFCRKVDEAESQDARLE